MCFFLGYPKGTNEGLFYCTKEQNVNVSTNIKFLELDYLINHVPRNKLVVQELSKGITTNETSTQIPKTIVECHFIYIVGEISIDKRLLKRML